MNFAGNGARRYGYKVAGLALVLVSAVVIGLVYQQFRGELTSATALTVMAPRAGLVLDPGSKVTLNGLKIGRVNTVEEVNVDGTPMARITLGVDPESASFIPANVDAAITASTIFGNKYVAFTSPPRPDVRAISPTDVITIREAGVTTEFNTLFETITEIAEKVDPVQLNMTLTATADALTGLGDKFGRSLEDANAVLAQVNPRMPQVANDIGQLGELANIYADSADDLFTGLRSAVTSIRTVNAEQGNLDAALIAAVGFGNTGTDIFERGAPYLVRGQADLTPTASLLDEYSPELFCTIRNYHDVAPKVSEALGSNGYSSFTNTALLGGSNPYVYPDNLPRINARGGPGGRPGCWQSISRDLWPAPYLVMDSGASIAPNNHFGLGSPLLSEYVWGRQVGELTVNP